MIFNIVIAFLLLVIGSLVIYSITQILGFNTWKNRYESENEQVLKDIKQWFDEIKRTNTLEADNLEANKNLKVKEKAEIKYLSVGDNGLYVNGENIMPVLVAHEIKSNMIVKFLKEMVRTNRIPQSIAMDNSDVEKVLSEEYPHINTSKRRWSDL